MHQTFYFDYQMDLTIDFKKIFNMDELVSVPNQRLIRRLLIYDFENYPQMHFNLMKILFCCLSQISIECRSLRLMCVLNSLVTSYLKSVVDKSLNTSVVKHCLLDYPANKEHDLAEIIMSSELLDCFVHNFRIMGFIHTIDLKPVAYKIPVEMHATKSKKGKTIKRKENHKKQIFSSDGDLQSFLLPLEQDYSKSSKGYGSYTTLVSKKVKDKNACKLLNETDYLLINSAINYEEKRASEEYETNNKVQKDGFSQYLSVLGSTSYECKSNNGDLSHSDDFFCLQDFDNCTIQNLRNKHSKITFNYSLDVFADQTKQQTDHHTKNKKYYAQNSADSSSDDSVSESHVKQERCNAFELDNFEKYCNDSDSEDSIVFTDNLVNYNVSDSIVLPEIFDEPQINGVSQKEFCGNKINPVSISSVDDDMYTNWDDGVCDADLFETFSLNFQSDFPIDNEAFSTYGYVNACFEDDDNDLFVSNHIRSINNNWNKTMKDVSSEPRDAKRVSFVPLPHLVSVQMFEPEKDGYRYSQYVLDQVRFQNRIKDFEVIIAPYLTSEHRAKIYHRNYMCEK